MAQTLTKTEAFENELRAAGYTEAQIAKEARYLERVRWESKRIRSERRWNFGLHAQVAA